MSAESPKPKDILFDDFRSEVLNDYRIALESREASLLGRREVLTGKAKFGIFGDGKEVAQLAMAKAFKPGDFRSGYYRDQTFMMAKGLLSVREHFAALYADTNLENEPASGGRQMGGHFSTTSLNEDGSWKNLSEQYNSSSDISPTGGQMARLLGLAQASKYYRHNNKLGAEFDKFSRKGNEIAFGTIGNASTSEGIFFEAINAAGVLQVPMILSVWDDEYGISVHAKYQTTKQSISEILKGFQRTETEAGFEILKVKGWDYPALMETYARAEKIAREEHVPVMVHVVEMTQPQGHSTSGSHERYKGPERLQWEADHDCILKMKQWMMANGIATEKEIAEMENSAKKAVREAKSEAWKNYLAPIKAEQGEAVLLIDSLAGSDTEIGAIAAQLKSIGEPMRRDIVSACRKALRQTAGSDSSERNALKAWLENQEAQMQRTYSSHLYSESEWRSTNISAVEPTYDSEENLVDARLILRDNFDKILSDRPEVLIFGEDSGKIGDVNQGLEGLQDKHGELRVSDAGIREATILGQGIGMAMRGLRPIAEIQYLDYLLYAQQVMSDDLATVHYRTVGRQKAPVIVRTRGHRLEGIWHSGSPLGTILHSMRGINILVPRNMTKAAGFYNTMLQADEPALIIECLNGYRLKERMPNNLGEFRTPVGQIEVLREGADITIVSYGSTLRIVMEAAEWLAEKGIECEVIDVQSLIPFDLKHEIAASVHKTNRLLVVDEDVPGGASAYILQMVVEGQDAWRQLDSKPQTLAAKAHRPAYGTDGDYFSKPSADDVFEKVYEMMREADPVRFPELR